MAIKVTNGESQPPQQTEKKKFEKKLYVGYAECSVVGINMNKEQMEALKWKVEKDPEYIDTTKDGVDFVNISITLRENTTGAYLPLKFTIYDKNKNKSSTGKYHYLNNLGWEAWAATEDDLQAKFAKRNPRLAKEGEAPFYNFMKKWLYEQMKGDDAELEFNLNKLLRGNFRELHDVVNQFKDQKVVVLATIHSYLKNGQPVLVQSVYNGDFLVAEIWGKPMLGFLNAEKRPNDIDYFLKNVTKEKYGCRDYYILEPLQQYKPGASPVENPKKEETVENTVPDDDLPF